MHSTRPTIVGIGELLWDLLPSGVHLGGAPANFCYIASVLGASATIVSRVGTDELGSRAVKTLGEHGLNTLMVQSDAEHPTGTVNVTLSGDGLPSYVITENVAWDHLAWNAALAELASRADAVCFGTLAQRSQVSRSTILRFLDHTPPDCLRVLDVNLRPPFDRAEIVRDSIRNANVVKLNHEELEFVLSACGLPSFPGEVGARALREYASLRAVCITRGARGSVIDTAEGTVDHPGVKVDVADTVGAGDAFTAAMTLELLNKRPLNELSDFANQVAGLVASKPGAMPSFGTAELELLRP